MSLSDTQQVIFEKKSKWKIIWKVIVGISIVLGVLVSIKSLFFDKLRSNEGKSVTQSVQNNSGTIFGVVNGDLIQKFGNTQDNVDTRIKTMVRISYAFQQNSTSSKKIYFIQPIVEVLGNKIVDNLNLRIYSTELNSNEKKAIKRNINLKNLYPGQPVSNSDVNILVPDEYIGKSLAIIVYTSDGYITTTDSFNFTVGGDRSDDYNLSQRLSEYETKWVLDKLEPGFVQSDELDVFESIKENLL